MTAKETLPRKEHNAIVVDLKDNVAVALEELQAGMTGICGLPDGDSCSVLMVETVPRYHKFALRTIAGGEPVIKYGEHIALAGKDILPGTHVHIHNVEKLKR